MFGAFLGFGSNLGSGLIGCLYTFILAGVFKSDCLDLNAADFSVYLGPENY